MNSPSSARHPSFKEAFLFWLKLGLISFGGPSGQIAMMQTELVEKKRWIGQARFLHALNYCMLLPGPEAQQLAIYCGWLLHRTAGGLVAGSLFVAPSVLVLWGLSYLYAAYGNIAWIAALFYGLKPVVMAIVAGAVVRIGTKALKNEVMWMISAAAFIAIFFFKIPFPAIIFGAGLIGLMGNRVLPSKFELVSSSGGAQKDEREEAYVLDDSHEAAEHTKPNLGRAIKVLTIGLLLWWTPLLVVALIFGVKSTLFREGFFFSKAAVVTFGGAYAVLPYVAQRAVESFHWLKPGQMLDGLGLAETTPGPLIMVLQFVGFMGGWNQPGPLSPLLAATLGALLTTWATFTPCFIWIFLGGPHIEQMRGNKTITAALSAITAAVVGVILNLAVWFALHVVHPEPGGFDWFAVALGLVALVGIIRWKWEIIPVVLGGAATGIIYHMLR